MRGLNKLGWAVLALCALLWAAPAAWAQDTSGTAQDEAPVLTADDEKALGLTEDQKTQLKDIRKNTREQVQAVRQDESLTPEQKRAKIREIERAQNERIRGVLTPEQQRHWARRRHDRREDVRDRREDRRDRREDVRDRRHDGGARDRREDVRDRREDRRDRRVPPRPKRPNR